MKSGIVTACHDEQLDEVDMVDARSQWISVDDRMPESKEGMWSDEVIALGNAGDIFKLSCMGSYWQRNKAFIESESEKITHWMPLIYPE